MKKTAVKKTDQEFQSTLKKLIDLESIIDRSPVIYAIFRMAENWPLSYISGNIDQWGFTKKDFLSGQITWQQIIHPEDVSRIEGEIIRYMKQGVRNIDQNYRIVDKSGEVRWVEDQNVFILDSSDKIIYLQSTIIDVTDRKKIQAALQESENIYRAIFENTGTAMAIAGADRTILLGNAEIERLTGFSREEVIDAGIKWESFIALHDLERLEGYHESRLGDATRTPKQYEFQIRTKKGELKDIFMTSGLIPGTKKSLVSMMDITDRKKAEMQLQKSEIRIQELLRNSFDIIVVQDERGVYRYVSPSVKRILGYSEADLIGRQCFDFLHPDERKKAFDTYNKIIADKKNEFIAEFRLLHRNGSWINMELLGNNCLDNPAVNGIIISARDVTDRKRIETRLSHSQKMEAIGTLAGGIAHDFNNLLMGIQGYVSLMLLRKDEGDPDFAKLNNIQNLVQRGADLTAKLLGFARGGQYEVKPADLNELISRTINIFARTKKEITIHQKYAKNLWTVEVDRSQIEQVLINIYVNAWQAMTREGGDIYVETDNIVINGREARLLSMRAGDYVRTTITDTGSGMAEDTRSRVFEPFFTTKEKSRGVGLSLASAYGIIREHGGTIEVASELGQGTVFNIYIPASAKEIAKEKTKPEAIVAGVETILLVDDEESVLDVCKEILIAMGYNVLCADNGREALNIYGMYKNKIDLVMLDMIMPGLSGSETYDAMKLINPQVKVMLSTGYSVSDQAKQIMGRGCQALIQKPFRMDDLSQKVREVIGSK